MKRSPDGFLCLFRGKRPAWVREMEVWLRKHWGNPCRDYAPMCGNCRVWEAFAVIYESADKKLESVTKPHKK